MVDGGTASLTVDMPSWDIVERARMAATVFVYQQLKPTQDDQDNSMILPNGVKK
jgi:hypothetical protein